MNENIFREYDIRGIVGTDLDEQSVRTVALAIGTFFSRSGVRLAAVGFDARASSPLFRDILVRALRESGCEVLDIGRVPTPVLYFTIFSRTDVDGGVMITGSHNPTNHNGFKICLGRDALFGQQIQAIRKIALAGESSGASTQDASRLGDALPPIQLAQVLGDYQRELLQRVAAGEKNLKVVVDAGNGMGGVTAVPLYRALGYEVVELYCEPDSTFPNHEPDPSKPENLSDLISAVIQNKADLGIAFDGDADRITVVDETGRIVWGDELLILFARDVLRRHPGSTVIAEVKCSQTLFDEIERAGGKPLMVKAGHSIIKSEMKKTGAILAGEMSGHIFFADRFYGFDDAAYAGGRLLELVSSGGQTLSERLAALPQTVSTPEIRVPCSEEKKFEIVREIAEEFSKTNRVITIDGARIVFENGWGIVRASNTQAILVLRFEADTEENLLSIRQTVEARVKFLVGQNETP